MNLKLFFIGLLFLANPNINIIDIIPDFIGLGIVWFSITKISDLSSDIYIARRGVAKLFWTELAKLLSFIWLIIYSSDSGFFLVFTFIFTIIELIFFIPTINSFMNGTMILSTKYDGNKSVSSLQSAGRATIVFIILRNILTLLPQLAYLYIEDGVGYVLEPYIGIVIILSAFLQLIAGIIWIIKLAGCYNILKTDFLFLDNMKTDYQENIFPDRSRFIKRSLKTGFMFLGAFVLLSFNIFFDGKPLIPRCLSAVSCLLMMFVMRKYVKSNFLISVCAAVLGIVSTAAELYARYFASKYYYLGISKSVEAYSMFKKHVILAGINSAVMCVLIILIFIMLLRIISDHTGIDRHNELESIIIKEQSHKKDLRKLCIAWLVFGIICAIDTAVYSACLYLWQPYWIIDLILYIIWFAVTVNLISKINESIERKYL